MLGLSEQDLWHLTPYEVELLAEAHAQKRRLEALPVAMMIQVLCNVHRDPKQRPQPFEVTEVLSWLGFAPEDAAPEAEPPRPTTEDLRQKLEALRDFFPSGNGQGRDG